MLLVMFPLGFEPPRRPVAKSSKQIVPPGTPLHTASAPVLERLSAVPPRPPYGQFRLGERHRPNEPSADRAAPVFLRPVRPSNLRGGSSRTMGIVKARTGAAKEFV